MPIYKLTENRYIYRGSILLCCDFTVLGCLGTLQLDQDSGDLKLGQVSSYVRPGQAGVGPQRIIYLFLQEFNKIMDFYQFQQSKR